MERKVLLPGATILSRLISRVRNRAANSLWYSLTSLTTGLQQHRLEWLLEISEDGRQSHLDRLRQGSVRISGPALVEALEKVEEISNLGVTDIDLSQFPPSRIKALAQYVSRSKAYAIRRMPERRRIAVLLAFSKTVELTAMDDALNVFEQLADSVFKKARQAGEKNRMRSLRDLDRAALDLRKVCEMVLNKNVPSEKLRDAIFKHLPQDKLEDACCRVGELARPSDDNYEQEITESYRAVRRFLPKFLDTIYFAGTQSGKPVLKALSFLKSIEGNRSPDMMKAPLGGISKAWQRKVIGQDGEINKQAYTLCTLERLHAALRRRDVFVPASTK